MDLNGDGKLDILSGCYDYLSDFDPDSENMAGLFHVLWGKDNFQFAAAEVLKGTDDKPLITGSPFRSMEEMENFDETKATKEETQAFYDSMSDTFCTRPTAADIDADGNLDLVVGNGSGTFYLVRGSGNGQFNPKGEQMMAGKEPLRVSSNSDPCVVDWDGDGDLDIVSGSRDGAVHLSVNQGDKSKPDFQQFTTLIGPPSWNPRASIMGDDHIKGPSGSARVFVSDLNGDGKLDILVGDSVMLRYPVEGLDEDEARKKLAALEQEIEELQAKLRPKQTEIFEKFAKKRDDTSDKKEISELEQKLAAELGELSEDMDVLYEKRESIVTEVSTGYVWVYYQKKATDSTAQSVEEFRQYVAGKMDGLSEEQLKAIAEAVDKDSNGSISETEFEARFEAISQVLSESGEET